MNCWGGVPKQVFERSAFSRLVPPSSPPQISKMQSNGSEFAVRKQFARTAETSGDWRVVSECYVEHHEFHTPWSRKIRSCVRRSAFSRYLNFLSSWCLHIGLIWMILSTASFVHFTAFSWVVCVAPLRRYAGYQLRAEQLTVSLSHCLSGTSLKNKMNHVHNFLLKIFGVISDDVKVLQDVIKILENFRKQSRILPDVR